MAILNSLVSTYSTGIYGLFAISLLFLLVRVSKPRPLPQGAPRLLSKAYPIIGSLGYFKDRYAFYKDGIASTRTGSFSFYGGKHHIVGLSGLTGRKTFYESKHLDFSQGYYTLSIQGTTHSPPAQGKFSSWYGPSLARTIGTENLRQQCHSMVQDAMNHLSEFAGTGNPMDPFEVLDHAICRLTMSAMGAREFTASQQLASDTLNLHREIVLRVSPARVIFPWLPTPARMKKPVARAKFCNMLSNIVRTRKGTHEKEPGVFQSLIDTGRSTEELLFYITATLTGSQVNTPILAAWLLVYLATDSCWLDRVREEVDMVLSRSSRYNETPEQTLRRLPFETWESGFPTIALCLRETLRLHFGGSAFRRNQRAADTPIGETGEFLPPDVFVLFLTDDVHFNPEIYPNPSRWDPGRYLPHRAEGQKVPLSFLGWGAGRHPCIGKKLAEFETTIVVAIFVAMFHFSLCDGSGNPMALAPAPDRRQNFTSKPRHPVRLRCLRRESA